MDKNSKIELLKNKKETLSLMINLSLGVILTFLAIATPIVASTIIAFNNNAVTIFMLFI